MTVDLPWSVVTMEDYRGTYIVIHFIKVFVEHFNKMNDLHHIGAHFTPWGVSKFKNFGPSGHRPLISFVKKFLI